MTAGAVKGEDVARYTAGARVPTADVAMATPFDFDFQYQKAGRSTRDIALVFGFQFFL